jgi:hypothetical protein
MIRAKHSGALLALLSATTVACGSSRSVDTTQRAAVAANAPQSSITGPFVNDPVAPAPLVAALPSTASNAPLLRAPDTTNTAQNPTSPTAPTEPTPTPPIEPTPTPTVDPQANNSPDHDALLDGLLGVWADGPTRTARDGNGYVVSECVLTVRSPTDAREECTTTTRYGDNERDRCGQTGQLRRWVTASPYTLSESSGYVTFTPGEVELVRDDEGRCQYRAAGQHTTMTTVGWSGHGATISVRNARSDGSDQGMTSYTRRSGAARR